MPSGQNESIQSPPDVAASPRGSLRKDAHDIGIDEISKNRARPLREASPKDYFRIFTDYARKWDIVLMVVGIFASIGTGVVSSSF